MEEAHKAEGEKLFEMSSTMKEQFDRCFPAVCGQYPKLSVSVIPLDTEENQILPELSGVLVKYDIRFDQIPQWKVKDQAYELYTRISIREKTVKIEFISRNKSAVNMFSEEWEDIKKKYDLEKVLALEEEFAQQTVCPKAKDIIEIWKPFSDQMDLYEAWRIYHDSQQETWVNIPIVEIECPDIVRMCLEYGKMVCVYQGIVTGDLKVYHSSDESNIAVFLMRDTWKPMVDISRSKVAGFPLITLLAINGILDKYQMLSAPGVEWRELEGWKNSTLKEWKKMKDSQLDRWLRKNQEPLFTGTMRKLQKSCEDFERNEFSLSGHGDYAVLYKYMMVWFQEKYQLTINYEAGQIICFCEKEGNETDEIFDLFPPMMFCVAASDQSRQYICSANFLIRRGITADHPFIIWLLKNAAQLNRYYQRQFQQIVNCLCESSAETIVKECNRIREQFIAFPEHHSVDVSSFPQLCLDDFWSMEEE